MKIGKTKLIPENIKPPNAVKLAVFKGTTKVCTVDISRMEPSNIGSKLYSFGLLSDIHIVSYKPTSSPKFDNALSYFEEKGALFCCHCGDLTDFGLWYPISETDGTSYYDPQSFEEYKRVCQNHAIPVYGNCGNHESYNGYNITGTYTDTYGANPTLVINGLEKLQEYTGNGLNFTITHGNDVFVFLGQPSPSEVTDNSGFQWLYNTLEVNRNKRCFVFVHSYIEEDSGDPLDLRENGIFEHWNKTKESVFKKMLSHYKNTILFHGHSHTKFYCQELDKNANYTDKNGFKSVHVPSCGYPRDIINNQTVNDYDASEGYLVDVYENCIVLNGMDLINNTHVPIAQYRIDTTLQGIEANTFTDSTGTITT